jgi:hypothetical protein
MTEGRASALFNQRVIRPLLRQTEQQAQHFRHRDDTRRRAAARDTASALGKSGMSGEQRAVSHWWRIRRVPTLFATSFLRTSGFPRKRLCLRELIRRFFQQSFYRVAVVDVFLAIARAFELKKEFRGSDAYLTAVERCRHSPLPLGLEWKAIRRNNQIEIEKSLQRQMPRRGPRHRKRFGGKPGGSFQRGSSRMMTRAASAPGSIIMSRSSASLLGTWCRTATPPMTRTRTPCSTNVATNWAFAAKVINSGFIGILL